MKKTIFGVLVTVLILGMGSIALASMLIPNSEQAREHAKAPEHSQGIQQTESDYWGLERVDFIHYAKPAKPERPGRPPKEPTCYKLLGVQWRDLPVDYLINPENPFGLSKNFVGQTISTAAETWDEQTSSELFADSYEFDSEAQYGLQNFENAIAFGDYPQAGVIGVTSIWYTRRGKQIVEFDILLDTDFEWGDAEANPAVMDLQNIIIHELGHGVGLGDIYTDACSEVTMYGYSQEGETSKRTLEPADILGLQKMYGE